MGSYIFSVTVAGILCAIITSILGDKGTYGTIIKMLAGIFLAVTMISPLGNLRLGNLEQEIQDWRVDGNAVASQGQEMSTGAMIAIIKEETEAYILDKAASLGVTLSVEVMVEDGNVPRLSGVQLSGQVSPYARQQLSTWISNDLGISKENQKWIGSG